MNLDQHSYRLFPGSKAAGLLSMLGLLSKAEVLSNPELSLTRFARLAWVGTGVAGGSDVAVVAGWRGWIDQVSRLSLSGTGGSIRCPGGAAGSIRWHGWAG